MSELLLTGLDGSNPLAFFAALGVLEATSVRWPSARLHWRDEGVWRPVVSGLEVDLEGLLGVLDEDRAACMTEPALALEYVGTRDLKPPHGVFRAFLAGLVEESSMAKRRGLDWAASFATDVAVDNNGNTKPTALHFTAGQQTWLGMVAELVSEVNREDLREAVVGPWRYERKLKVAGWDATTARDYALRASDPAQEKKAGVPGADWLAVRGLACLGVVPRRNRILTTGCTGEWKTGRFTWPLWETLLGIEMVRTTLRLTRLAQMSERERKARGIGIVFQSGIRRSDQGGYGSFTPSAAV